MVQDSKLEDKTLNKSGVRTEQGVRTGLDLYTFHFEGIACETRRGDNVPLLYLLSSPSRWSRTNIVKGIILSPSSIRIRLAAEPRPVNRSRNEHQRTF